MLAAIGLVLTLGARAQGDLGREWPRLSLASLTTEASPSQSAADWPLVPPKDADHSHKSGLNLTGPIVMASIGAAVLGLGALGAALVSGSCGGKSPAAALADLCVCVPGVIGFGLLASTGGVTLLVGVAWLIVDLVVNTQPPALWREKWDVPAKSAPFAFRF